MKNFTVTDWSKQNYNVSVEKNKSLSIDCLYTNAHSPKQTSVRFEIGGEAVYGSYNLTYTGKIISITEKTVTIDTEMSNGFGTTEKRRLSLADFCNYNWDFNSEKIARENAIESMCI